MRNVVLVSHSSTFSDINRSGFQLSGKTGTAQQSKTHPDHALFIGFAPSDSPEVAFATRIANGYSSTYAAEVARDVMKYYYQLTPENELIPEQLQALVQMLQMKDRSSLPFKRQNGS